MVSALALGLLLTAQPARGAGPATQQIEQAVGAFFEQGLGREAARRGWQGMRITRRLELPPAATHLPACTSAPEVRATGAAASLLERQQLRIHCPDAGGWTLDASAQASVSLPVAHAAGLIERGQAIGAADLVFERINVAKAQRGYYNQPAEVAGMAAKRRIRAGQLITPALLAQPLAVRRGEAVKIIASQDGIEASTAGEALADGQPGEVIRVRNVRSGKVIDAKVQESGVVASIF
nr:flagellar basal body P-ring formation chaperone FlgA [Pseudomonas oligotrophica]